jgi:hypothetical protein
VFVDAEDVCCTVVSVLESDGVGVGKGEEELLELLVANLVLKEGSKDFHVIEEKVGGILPVTRYMEHAANVAAYAPNRVVPL